ncbi:MAG: hypothetical protein WC379_08640 [Methanoregula sp.]|jgi:hypothetical protein
MKFTRMNPYYRAALILLVAAMVLVTVAVLTGRNDLISAALVLAALTCLLTGIFISLLSTGDPVDSRYTSLLAVPGSISLSRVAADLGILGNACIIPKNTNGMSDTMQFLPVSEYDGSPLPTDTFVATVTAAGLLIVPSGSHLLRKLENADNLAIPREIAAIGDLIQEVGVDVIEVADRVTVSEDGGQIIVTMAEYRFLPGCRAMAAESIKCCTTNPCPVCSLYACILAEGTGKVVRVERCSADPGTGLVTAIFSLQP